MSLLLTSVCAVACIIALGLIRARQGLNRHRNSVSGQVEWRRRKP